jgi:hypothetical protein
MVIPVMDHLDQHLATSAVKLSLPTSIRAAATLGKRSLNKYYTKTDHTEVYRIAMGKSSLSPYLPCFNSPCLVVLHPRHKLDYFKTAGWDDEWIETARNIVREEFERTYKVSDAAEPSSASDTEDNAGSNKVSSIVQIIVLFTL